MDSLSVAVSLNRYSLTAIDFLRWPDLARAFRYGRQSFAAVDGYVTIRSPPEHQASASTTTEAPPESEDDDDEIREELGMDVDIAPSQSTQASDTIASERPVSSDKGRRNSRRAAQKNFDPTLHEMRSSPVSNATL